MKKKIIPSGPGRTTLKHVYRIGAYIMNACIEFFISLETSKR